MLGRRIPVNYSCNQNVGLMSRAVLVTILNVQKDNEINFDYSTCIYNDPATLRWLCGKSSVGI